MEDFEAGHDLVDNDSGVVGGISFEDFRTNGEKERNLKRGRVGKGAIKQAV